MRTRTKASFFIFLLMFNKIKAQESPFALFQKAYAAKDYNACIENGKRVNALVDHPFLKYQLAECYSGNKMMDSAIFILEELSEKGLPYDIVENASFKNLQLHPSFAVLKNRFLMNSKKVQRSSSAFVMKEKFLIPEGITGTRDGTAFFVGSLAKNKIIKLSKQGEEDFIKNKETGLWSVVGMKLSKNEKELWVCSAGMVDSVDGRSGIFVFDTRSGKLIKKFIVPQDKEKHLFNDLTFTNDAVYITDSKAGKVWMIRNDSLLTGINAGFIYPNGIAFNHQSNLLYIADYTGISVYDLRLQKLSRLSSQTPTYLSSIDGLYYTKNSLIAIQNSGNDIYRIARFFLNKAGDTIVHHIVLQSHEPDFAMPTTGAVVNNDFYFIANSFLKNMDAKGVIQEKEKIKLHIVKKLSLN
jgi:hypothetical protein